MNVIGVSATLTVISGTVSIADGHVAAVEVTVDASSYASPSAKRNSEVIGAGFLDAKTHPTITFTAQGPRNGEVLSGKVTVKGKTTPLDFAVSDISVDGDTSSFKATATADRTKLGVDKMPTFIIASHLNIDVTATAART